LNQYSGDSPNGYRDLSRYSLPYDERCALLGIDRLELRRLRADLIMCYKIVRGLVLVSASRFFSLICSLRTRGHSYKLFLPD